MNRGSPVMSDASRPNYISNLHKPGYIIAFSLGQFIENEPDMNQEKSYLLNWIFRCFHNFGKYMKKNNQHFEIQNRLNI